MTIAKREPAVVTIRTPSAGPAMNDNSVVIESSANVSAGDAWVKQVLYIIAYNDQHLAAVEEALGATDGALKTDTVVMVSVSDGDDAFLY